MRLLIRAEAGMPSEEEVFRTTPTYALPLPLEVDDFTWTTKVMACIRRAMRAMSPDQVPSRDLVDLPPHQVRVIFEQEELTARLERLREFVRNNPVFGTLPDEEQSRLLHQCDLMQELSEVLQDRIQAFKPATVAPLTGSWRTRCCVCGAEYENGIGSTECCGAAQEIIKPGTTVVETDSKAAPEGYGLLEIADTFRGDNRRLLESIRALIRMSDDACLVPHGIGGHARALLAACFHRLPVPDKCQAHQSHSIKPTSP